MPRKPTSSPHPIQSAIWKEYEDLNPGVTVVEDGEKVCVGLKLDHLTETEARAILDAARIIVGGRSLRAVG